MRTFSVALLLAMTACGSEVQPENDVVKPQTGEGIECAIGGGAFARGCTIERGDGNALTLRHGDGGFRRLTLENDGSIDTADGADAVTVQPLSDGRTEIAVGGDRYRLPAGL